MQNINGNDHRKFNLAEVSPPYFTLPHVYYGGIEKVVTSRISHLRDLGHHITLAAPIGTDENLADKSEFFKRVKININAMKGRGTSSKVSWIVYTKALSYYIPYLSVNFGKDVEVVINDAFRSEPWISMSLALKFGINRTLNVLHGNFPIGSFHAKYFSKAYAALNYGALNKRLFQEMKRLGYHVFYFPNGIEMPPTDSVTTDPDDYLLFIGRINKSKFPYSIIKLAKELGKKLIIIGPIHDPIYFSEIVKPQLSRSVSYAGNITRNELHDYLRKATALLYANTGNDPQAAVLLEALSFGIPVIGTYPGPYSGFYDIVHDGVNGLCGSSVEELKTKFKQIDNLDRRAIHAETKKEWSWENIIKMHHCPAFEFLANNSKPA